MIAAISAVHWQVARSRSRFYGSASQAAPVGMDFSATSRCWLRLAQHGSGAVQQVVVGLFGHVLARVCQRGSRQTGAMV